MNSDGWFKVFELLQIKELLNIRKVNKELKTVIDGNPCLFWYKHYDLVKSSEGLTASSNTHSEGYYETIRLLYFSTHRCSLNDVECTEDRDVARSFTLNLL